jgi:hypothetical protein
MTDRTRFEQMLEHLINGEQSKAEEVFHDLVVAKSREIYENLLDDDFQVDETTEDDVEEDVEENFDLEAVGGDGADAMIDAVTDGGDMDGDMDGGMGDEMSMDDEEGDAPATKDDVMDIKDALDELRAEFEAKMGGNSDDMDSMDDEEGAEDDGEESEEEPEDEEGDDEENPFAKESMREYVEKVAPAKMGDNGVSNKSTVAGKNPLGNTGTTANIAKGGESNKGGTQGGLANPSTKDLNTGNVNVPGSKTATKMHPTKGHGAEKKGSGDNGVNTRSIVGK